ncbi:MAG: 50S ribosomal protein L24 [Candidatus Sungbacteria bacterium RIFCSPLOWO2_01_FULL_59_16]|uniref:Large ribosomal subunit protein uL24 n=1 Tax=Candidatus Sungbacteria bacterium RIFCSPLOWO2_01_FULL_59_16 TaxID=1802280 RepID=A0A1G2LBF8_9BACT|nr:MAG: 50S ribosomal protein L24 [Candidatus Sungbacteria bacterium RIFCSPLOWO2_01_FULL_59_16]
MKIRKGDTVKVLSGKDRGKRAKVIRVFPEDEKISVEGVNVKKKHRRARRQDRKGEIALIPAPLSASAVQVICPSCSKPTRVGYGRNETGKKIRTCKKCGKEL